ncbi:MAG: type II toxin-antitoxin system VapB family antitoxin [Bifidobacteriaceae bacterium]|nr:type II toxin-antitoxin system VapB family antitoxin [Bifidobacteriaceae bacterium]
MAVTSIDIPAELLAEVQRLTGKKTKRGAVILALEEAAARRKNRAALESLAGMAFLGDLGRPEVRAKARG